MPQKRFRSYVNFIPAFRWDSRKGPTTPMEIMSTSLSLISNTKPTEVFSENFEPGRSCLET